MELKLPPGTPDNIKIAYDESRRILSEAFDEAIASSKKYDKEEKNRRYLQYCLKFISSIGAIFITAGYLTHQLAILIAIIYAIDSILLNNRRLIVIKQAVIAFTVISKNTSRTHQTKLARINADTSDKVERVKKFTDLNIALTEAAHEQFALSEKAIDNSDIETLQALSLDEEKLKLAMKYIK